MFSRQSDSNSKSLQEFLDGSRSPSESANVATNATATAATTAQPAASRPPIGSSLTDAASQTAAPALGNSMPRSAHGQRSAQDANRTAPRQDGVSVIGRDLAILGDGLKIVSRGKIQIEGEVRGDVYGEEILIGDQGKVSGTVAATQVVVRGAVQGTVRGKDVVLASTAHVEADVHHASLSLEQGAMFEGRSRRPADVSSLLPNLDELTAEHDASKAEKQNRSVSSLS